MNDTIADIVDDMRKAGALMPEACKRDLWNYADRIEAAAAREEERHADEISAVGLLAAQEAAKKMRQQPGNAARMREALMILMSAWEIFIEGNEWVLDGNYPNGWVERRKDFEKKMDVAKAALAAPPRNCDRFRTLAEAVMASGEATAEAPGINGMGNTQLVRFCNWLFAPAGKEARND